MAIVVALTGGIGSGKSVVADVLRRLSFPVYDCDSNAKRLMDCSDNIHARLVGEINPAVVKDGKIDRKLLSEIVFADEDKLICLNKIVHGEVRDDISDWINRQNAGLLFVETAILYQSGLDKMVDMVWDVTAPEALRIERVTRRSGMSASQVKARIVSQNYVPREPVFHSIFIVNDGLAPLLPQIEDALGLALKISDDVK